MFRKFNLLALSALFAGASAFDYSIVGAGDLALTDEATGISGVSTIFTGEDCGVSVSGIEWEFNNGNTTFNDKIKWTTYVDGEEVAAGEYDLSTLQSRELPDSLDCGTFVTNKRGTREIHVTLSVDDSEADTASEYQAFAAGASLVPLCVVLALAMGTQMVELSLFLAVFVGSSMVHGGINEGFKRLIDTYILENILDWGHGAVILFTLFLSATVGVIQKSGGMSGFTNAIKKIATSPRLGQVATFLICCCVFFDDYTNLLLTGSSVKPLTDMLMISREKIAFLVDGTAAPLASLTPISSWVGFEVSLIQAELDKLISIYGEENLTIETSAMAVFMQSIKYRYYPIFMLIIIALLIGSQRDVGPMLIAERKARVYRRTDGGEGKVAFEQSTEDEANAPRKDQPTKAWNMAVPIILLIFFIFYLMLATGNDGSGEQSILDKIESSDSFLALMWGTVATSLISGIFYLLQIVKDGEVTYPTYALIKEMYASDSEEETAALVQSSSELQGEISVSSKPRPLMTVHESVEAFLTGLAKIFPALVVLVLAWASGTIMTEVGCDRLFSRLINGGIAAELVPTLSFALAVLMALATGSSWGTMTILFPLLCIPTYQVSNGDPLIFYSTVAGILSGSVAGDHVSPISDTTVISSMSCGSQLLQHVLTQAPYAALAVVLSICCGSIPFGYQAFPNIVGIGLGTALAAAFVFFVCVPVVAPNGRFDFLTELYIKCQKGESNVNKLRNDCIAFAAGTDVDEPCLAEMSDDEKQATTTDDHSGVSADNLEDDITV